MFIMYYPRNIAILIYYPYICSVIKYMIMWNEMTNTAILKTLGERLKEYRLRQNLQQAELAKFAGINISTVARIEKGQNIMIDGYLRVMRVLDMLENLDEFIPEPPRSPLLMKKLMGKKKQRIKKSKEDNDE